MYGLVCALKGDLESAREAQLVSAIDRASKCLDPSYNKSAADAASRFVLFDVVAPCVGFVLSLTACDYTFQSCPRTGGGLGGD